MGKECRSYAIRPEYIAQDNTMLILIAAIACISTILFCMIMASGS